MEEEIGKRARELDSQEIIYRIRVGPKTIIRLIIAVCIWISLICLMCKIL